MKRLRYKQSYQLAGKTIDSMHMGVLQVDKEQQSKLCVHKLPDGTTAAAVVSAFIAACKKAAAGAEAAAAEAAAAAVEAAAVQELGGPGSKPQLLLAFLHPGLANDAFAALPGERFCLICILYDIND